jgi:3-methyladenine DNA glycosylase AlkC
MHLWEQAFLQFICEGQFDNAITIFDNLTGVSENLSLADKGKLVQIIEDHLAGLEQAREWLDKLLDSQSPIARDLGALLTARLIPSLYAGYKPEVLEILARIADDPNWEVRESAAHVFLQLLKVDCNAAFSLLNEWVKHPSENIRRATAITIKKIGKECRPEWGAPLLDLIEPLLSDRSRYVCKNLGPFAIGDGLLRYYPQLTLERLQHWSTWEDEQVRWNVAMVFSAAEGAKHLDKAINILDQLARDERRYVWRAVASAMRNLGRRSPERIQPVLERWMEDPLRSSAAQVALKYLA